jgi:hypothetical protein
VGVYRNTSIKSLQISINSKINIYSGYKLVIYDNLLNNGKLLGNVKID